MNKRLVIFSSILAVVFAILYVKVSSILILNQVELKYPNELFKVGPGHFFYNDASLFLWKLEDFYFLIYAISVLAISLLGTIIFWKKGGDYKVVGLYFLVFSLFSLLTGFFDLGFRWYNVYILIVFVILFVIGFIRKSERLKLIPGLFIVYSILINLYGYFIGFTATYAQDTIDSKMVNMHMPDSTEVIHARKATSLIEEDGTALKVEPFKSLPASFALKSEGLDDSNLSYTASADFPASNHDSAFNKLMRAMVHSQMKREKPLFVTKGDSTHTNITNFEIWLIDFKTSGALVYCLFRAQSYTEGAAHYNHWYVTLNYDTIRKKKIAFTDVFKFSKYRSKNRFWCYFAPGNSEYYEFSTTSLDSKTDYDVTNKQLTIYPNSDGAEENITYTVDLKSVQDYMDPVLGKELGLIEEENINKR